ncbi:MAG: formylglycine-generating enzyme family protein [Pirellulales bacterium]
MFYFTFYISRLVAAALSLCAMTFLAAFETLAEQDSSPTAAPKAASSANPSPELERRKQASAPTGEASFENSVGMKFTYIPPGDFLFGSPADDRHEGEFPQRPITIKGFHLGVYEVTQGEYARVMGDNPSLFSRSGGGREVVAGKPTDLCPVDSVSSEMAERFCRKLSQLSAEQAAGRTYRLPTESEWEYACRAETKSPFHCGILLDVEYAHFSRQGSASPLPVGTRKPNPWGLHDMHGNLQEWCTHGDAFVLRGGSWRSQSQDCRSASRFVPDSKTRAVTNGLRVLCETSASSR